MEPAITSSAGTPDAAARWPGASRAKSAAAVLALSLGCFSFVSTELMPVGVLPAMADGLHVSLGAAGYLVSSFAFVVALTATPLTGWLGRWNRKLLMAALLAVCCLGNVVTFLAPSYGVVLAGRLLVAAAIGVFWSTAVVTAVHLVSSRNAVRATSIVFGGVSLATVLGVPAGTLLGEHAGWQAVFGALAILSFAVFAVIAWSVPAVSIARTAKRGTTSTVLRSRPLLGVLLTTGLVVTGNFLAYTYISPYLSQVGGQSAEHISVLLLMYGAAGVVANFAITPIAAKSLRSGFIGVTALLALSLLGMYLAGSGYVATLLAMAVWGAAYGALPVLLQTSVFNLTSKMEDCVDAATSVNVAVFNAAVGMGAWVGGMIVNQSGPASIPAVAAGFVMLGLIVVLLNRNGSRQAQ
ncbi:MULTISPECIES: MFS transporter [Pandoraea]|uniref:MFS transporter n=1 Tax=Pandoraea TaxID=93217 RepID=UPI001F5C1383|nr:MULTISPECIES: MFS transporter [Pandoraea]MCI3205963.1 MFS transporter [Pandoraea sp. LA3]MDN4583991.1 MFS transporter [Pandoraea capi]